MRTRTVVVLAVVGIGAFLLYQHFEKQRAAEQCKRNAVASAALSGTGMSGIKQGLIRCAVLHGSSMY